jgi:hypothetical protein
MCYNYRSLWSQSTIANVSESWWKFWKSTFQPFSQFTPKFTNYNYSEQLTVVNVSESWWKQWKTNFQLFNQFTSKFINYNCRSLWFSVIITDSSKTLLTVAKCFRCSTTALNCIQQKSFRCFFYPLKWFICSRNIHTSNYIDKWQSRVKSPDKKRSENALKTFKIVLKSSKTPWKVHKTPLKFVQTLT